MQRLMLPSKIFYSCKLKPFKRKAHCALIARQIIITLLFVYVNNSFGQDLMVESTTLSSDQQMVSVIDSEDDITIWNTANGEFINSYMHPNAQESFISPDNKFIISTSDSLIIVFSIPRKEIIIRINSLDSELQQYVEFSNDSKFLIYNTYETTHVWSLIANTEYFSKEIDNGILKTSFIGDSELAVIDDYGKLQIWNFQTGKKTNTLNFQVYSSDVYFRPKQKELIFEFNDSLEIWDLATSKRKSVINLEETDFRGVENNKIILKHLDSTYAYQAKEPYSQATNASIYMGKSSIRIRNVVDSESLQEIDIRTKQKGISLPKLILPNPAMYNYEFGALIFKYSDFRANFSENYAVLTIEDLKILDYMVFDIYKQRLIKSGRIDLNTYLKDSFKDMSASIESIYLSELDNELHLLMYSNDYILDYNLLEEDYYGIREFWDSDDYLEEELLPTNIENTDYFVNYSGRKEIEIRTSEYFEDDDSTIWTSPALNKNCNQKAYLVDSNILVLSKPNDSVNYRNSLYWYNFKNDRIEFSSNDVMLARQRLFQMDNHLLVAYTARNGSEYKEMTYDTLYINLINGISENASFTSNMPDFERAICDTLGDYKLEFHHEGINNERYVDPFKIEKLKNQGKFKTELDADFAAPYVSAKLETFDAPDFPMYINFIQDNKVTYHSTKGRGLVIEPRTHLMKFWNGNIKTDLKMVYFIVDTDGNHVFYTDDGYYFGTSALIQKLNFDVSNEIYSFSQFDLKFNRPDIILQRLGYSTPEQINQYHKAYQKRLKKMGFTEDMLKEDFHLPVASINKKESIHPTINADIVNLEVSMTDTKYPLDRMNIWINNVPIYGIKGISLRSKMIQDFDTTISIQLNEGDNKIEMSVLNQAGAESYKETVRINSTKTAPKPNLYFIGIGAKEFEDSSMNLSYSDKDIRDIARIYSTSHSFGHIYIDTFLNQNVTKEIIPEIKKRLATSSINDQVILMYSGHGVLDDNLDYFLSTYDINFQKPKKKGLPYNEIDGLLDGIPARKKLILIDACHSGEVDKDETTFVHGVTELNTGKGDLFKKITSKGNSFEVMKELFTDLRRGTGVTVISSSAGAYYSYEDKEHQNGIYTYALKEGLSGEADMNHNNEISVSELKAYLYERVLELSNGRQKPTTRQENLEFDFRVW